MLNCITYVFYIHVDECFSTSQDFDSKTNNWKCGAWNQQELHVDGGIVNQTKSFLNKVNISKKLL